MTYDGTRLKLYLNGTLEGSLTVNQPTRSDNSQPAFLGDACSALDGTRPAASSRGSSTRRASGTSPARRRRSRPTTGARVTSGTRPGRALGAERRAPAPRSPTPWASPSTPGGHDRHARRRLRTAAANAAARPAWVRTSNVLFGAYAACDDGLFCNGADTCNGTGCAATLHAGDPCTGGADCNATCNESRGQLLRDRRHRLHERRRPVHRRRLRRRRHVHPHAAPARRRPRTSTSTTSTSSTHLEHRRADHDLDQQQHVQQRVDRPRRAAAARRPASRPPRRPARRSTTTTIVDDEHLLPEPTTTVDQHRHQHAPSTSHDHVDEHDHLDVEQHLVEHHLVDSDHRRRTSRRRPARSSSTARRRAAHDAPADARRRAAARARARRPPARAPRRQHDARRIPGRRPPAQRDRRVRHVRHAAALGLATFTLETWFKRLGTGTPDQHRAPAASRASCRSSPRARRRRTKGSNVDANYLLGIDADDNVLAADFEEGPGRRRPGRQNHPVFGFTTDPEQRLVPRGRDLRRHDLAALPERRARGGAVRRRSRRAPTASSTPPSARRSPRPARRPASSTASLDEARIWNYARTEAELRADLNVQNPSDARLVARWGLDEASATAVVDSAGHAAERHHHRATFGTGVDPGRGAPFDIVPCDEPATLRPPVRRHRRLRHLRQRRRARRLATFTVETWFNRTGTGIATSTGTIDGIPNFVPLVAQGRARSRRTRQRRHELHPRHQRGHGNVSRPTSRRAPRTGSATTRLNHPVATTPRSSTTPGTTRPPPTTAHDAGALYLDGNLEGVARRRPDAARRTTASRPRSRPCCTVERRRTFRGFFAGLLDEAAHLERRPHAGADPGRLPARADVRHRASSHAGA